ncbi:MAG TPA: FAD-dependent oxidoreductase [Myxococcaceae bacterium]|nr:FAD-dependent oxidoreductase [Myxococcaceae bacterium]
MIRTPRKSKHVHVLGAGIAGLTAAHELAERGYCVTVYDRDHAPGGKAATQYPWLRLRGHTKLHRMPAEHGFRLFPSFYRNVIHTMSRIPFDRTRSANANPDRQERGYNTVAENLLAAPWAAMVRSNIPVRIIPRAYGDKLGGFLRALEDVSTSLHFSEASSADTQRFQLKCLQFATSCRERRDQVGPHAYGGLSWWEFLGGDHLTPRFQQEVETFIRTMVAMDARGGNARTIGNVGMQLIFDLFSDGSGVDRVLNGPSSEQWLEPWERHLRTMMPRVGFRYGAAVTSISYDRARRRVSCFEYEEDHHRYTVPVGERDCVIAALPVDAMRAVLSRPASDELVNEDPSLTWIRNIDVSRYTAWMSGIQYYLERDVPIVRGHVYYPETPWKLSSVSQAQFWGPRFMQAYGAGICRGILSVDICDWEHNEGRHRAVGLLARECNEPKVVAQEIWAQLREAHQFGERSALPERYLGYHLDDSILFASPIQSYPVPDAYNRSRYFIHPPGSHLERPQARTTIPNLFLAGDYVQTNTDLATMEGANESAREAVNGLIEHDHLDGDLCEIFAPSEPAEFDYVKELDRDLFRRGEPHLFEVMGITQTIDGAPPGRGGALALAAGAVRGAQLVGEGLPRALERFF